MTHKYDVNSQQTIDTINHLLDTGIKKISILIRHSERFFSEEARMEPFMELTEKGKQFAVNFGTTLPCPPRPKLYSSFLGRCIETAYLIDKGFTKNNHQSLEHNCIHDMLTPFYIKDIERAVHQIQQQGNALFLRDWFDNRIDETIMEHPEKTSDRLTEFMIEQTKNLEENQIAICVSHDWNIYPLKEFRLDLKHESTGDVGYLDGVVFFERENQYYITNYQKNPVLL